MKTMRALEVGDRVKTKAFKDCNGEERFPAGTIGIVTQIDYIQNLPIRVSTNDDWWWYSADEIELVQELSAAEVLKICNEMCHKAVLCSDCKMHGNCFTEVDSDYQKVVEVCEQWKADHEEKEPEFEWVDVCRIIEVQDNGKKVCVHEEDLSEHWKELMVEIILKNYITTHEDNYIAVIERVCRVKQ